MPSHPTNEVKRAIEALLASGERSRAIALYHSYRRDHPAEALASVPLRDAYRRAIWAESDERERSPLPVPASDIVGRERELSEVTDALGRKRLAAIVGLGGVGKSRLALEAAYLRIAQERRVHWVDLAFATDAATLRSEIARALEIPSVRTGSFEADVASRSDLVVLDRCEEIVADAARVAAELVDKTQTLEVLVTSRSFSADVARIDLAPLPISGSGNAESEAVRFFLERALATNHRFRVDATVLAQVRDICSLLGGIPLAIEIAASYVGFIEAADLATRLRKGNLHDVAGAVTAILDWSYERLVDEDRALFRRLAIYDGTFSFGDAESAGGLPEIRSSLHRLAASSLIVPANSGDSLMQFRFADPVREYARRRLRETDELEETLCRIASALARIAEETDREISSGDPKAVLRLRSLASPVMTVLRAASGSDEALLSDTCRIAGALGPHLARTGYQAEMRELLLSLIEACEPLTGQLGSPYDRLLEAAAFLANRLGEFDLAIRFNERRIERARAAGDTAAAAYAMATSTQALMQSNRVERLQEIVEELNALLPRIDGEPLLARVHRALGSIAFYHMKFDRAKPHYEAFLQLDPNAISRSVYNIVLHDYGAVLAYGGDLAAGHTYFDACIQNTIDADPSTAAHAMASKGYWYLEEDRCEEAQQILQKAIAIFPRGINAVTQYYILEMYAGASLQDEQAEELRYILAFIETGRERMGFVGAATDNARMKRLLDAIESRLQPAALRRAQAAGRLASYDEILTRLARLKPGRTSARHFERFAGLSKREREIAERIAARLTNREIAEDLVVSVRTVDHHVASIFRKLGIQRREQLENR